MTTFPLPVSPHWDMERKTVVLYLELDIIDSQKRMGKTNAVEAQKWIKCEKEESKLQNFSASLLKMVGFIERISFQ